MSTTKKRNIYRKVQTLKGICSTLSPNQTQIPVKLPSIIKKGEDILPFLVDILIALKGANFLKDVLNEVLDSFVPQFELSAQNLIKSTILKANVSGQLVSDTSCLTDGFLEIPMSIVDILGKLRGQAVNLDDFQISLKNTIIGGQPFTLDNVLILEYLSSNNSVLVKAVPEIYSSKVSDIFESLGDGFKLDKQTLIDEIIDIIFNTKKEINKDLKRFLLLVSINQEQPRDLQYTRFDFNSVLGKQRQENSYISALDCDDNIVPLSQKDIDELYNSQNYIETIYEKAINMGDSNSTQNGKLGKNIFESILLALLDRLLLSNSFLFRFLVFKALDGDCRINPKWADLESLLQEVLKDFECLVKELRDKFFNYLIDVVERELTALALCIAQRYAKERIESYGRILSSLST